MMMTLSGFKSIPGIAGYLVSSDGKIWCKRYKRFLKPYLEHGYEKIGLTYDGSRKKHYVHRLVYMAFHGMSELPIGYEIDHIDFNRANNRPENLRLVTHAENVAHSVAAGRLRRS